MDTNPITEPESETQFAADFAEAKDYTVKQLRQVLFAGSPLVPKRLAVLLLERKKYPGKLDDLRRILDDELEDPRTRIAAATALGRLGTPAARQALRLRLDTPDARLLRGIRQALDHLAGAAKESEAAEPGEPSQPPTWGQTLAAYRTGSPGFEIPYPPENRFASVDPSDAQTVTPEATPPSLVSSAIAEIHRHLPGLSLSRQNALYLRCDDMEWLVLLASGKPAPKTPSDLARQKALLGMVAVRFEAENREWSPKYYILTQPGGAAGQVQIFLTTLRGRLALAGTAQVQGDRLEFSLRFLPEPGAIPFEVSGAYESGVVRLERLLAARTRLPPILLRPA
jgi:hypothetical protein